MSGGKDPKSGFTRSSRGGRVGSGRYPGTGPQRGRDHRSNKGWDSAWNVRDEKGPDIEDKDSVLNSNESYLLSSFRKPNGVGKFTTQNKRHWLSIWTKAKYLNRSALSLLLTGLAKTPPSFTLEPPPLNHLQDAVQTFLQASTATDNPAALSTDIGIVLNMIKRILKCTFDLERKDVQTTLENVLQRSEALENLQKPWAIIVSSSAEDAESSISGPDHSGASLPTKSSLKWRDANIEWLSCLSLFQPPSLPEFHVPDGKTKGLYASSREYFDTVIPVFVAMTFGEGHAALHPRCKFREKKDSGSACGHSLWKVSGQESMQCRVPNCHGAVIYACSNRHHKNGLCSSCYEEESAGLRGPPGLTASTDIYDGTIQQVNIDDQIILHNVASRKPPTAKTNWRTTSRLCCASLVAVIKIAYPGASIQLKDSIEWGEIAGSFDKDLWRDREEGKFTISLLNTRTGDLSQCSRLEAGQSVAIIDCKSFVPEFVPVLEVLEKQSLAQFPFSDGKLLNMATQSVGLERKQVEAAPASAVSNGNEPETLSIRQKIENLVDASNLDPVVEIRRKADLRVKLVDRLSRFAEESTFDCGQLLNFVESLKNPVHLIQGPPGTGKSYVGVAITRALLIIRDLWKEADPSIGQPPILVLSYKNHAIDEFLGDLVDSTRGRVSMIRCGGNCQNEALEPYSESRIYYRNKEMQEAKSKLLRLHGTLDKHKQAKDNLMQLDALSNSMLDSKATLKERRQATQTAVVLIYKALQCLNNWKKREQRQDANDDSAPETVVLEEISSRLISELDSELMSEETAGLPALYKDLAHIDAPSPAEVLFQWIQGAHVKPLCRFECPDENGTIQRCTSFADRYGTYCANHHCRYTNSYGQCDQSVCPGVQFRFCSRHRCAVDFQCGRPRQLAQDGRYLSYCNFHGCRKCVKKDAKVIGLATDEPPRNVYSSHCLCCALGNDGNMCNKVASVADDRGLCIEHIPVGCSGMTKKGNRCKAKGISTTVPFCHQHKDQMNNDLRWFKNPVAEDEDEEESDADDSESVNEDLLEDLDAAAQESEAWSYIADDYQQGANPEQGTDAMEYEETKNESGPVDEGFGENGSEGCDLFDGDSSYEMADDFAEEKKTDNIDEIEMPDSLQHLRDTYAAVEEDPKVERIHQELARSQATAAEEVPEMPVDWTPPQEWHWKMSLDERHRACGALLCVLGNEVSKAICALLKAIASARVEYRKAKIQAKSRLYEDKSIIGSTIVGCIARLESILAANPMAVVVEEASEVLEPLLTACLGPSICKLEMIGDHLQLKPSLQSKFDFEKINKVNISMFERLIRSPPAFTVPSGTLAVQRRMRSAIADLTRSFYHEIVEIEDHEICEKRKIGEAKDVLGRKIPRLMGVDIRKTATSGYLVPGVEPPIFFWTHEGQQTQANVGLSKINQAEANMICSLARYLVNCGVPKQCIAILTPYKGQLMLMREQLKQGADALLSKDRGNSVHLSTVDRFQGDEADVVLISLVTDASSRTPFVQLVNRMIVLLSRARIGMYLVGNMGYFENRMPEHWKMTFELLSHSGFGKKRIGSSITLCCPIHRWSMKEAKDPKDLALGFCKTKCQEKLPCSHQCNIACHWPSTEHNSKCEEPIDSPCPQHPGTILCYDLFSNIKEEALFHEVRSIEEALKLYACNVTVEVQLPCTHVEKFSCHKEQNYIKTKFPECKQQAHNPFVYPDCKHSLKCTCAGYDKFQADPSKAKKCNQEVEYLPPCGHALKAKCYLKTNYEQRSTPFVCPKKVNINLPRCGHLANVSCADALLLEEWSGMAASDNLIIQGQKYGPKDFDCQQTMILQQPCGHQCPYPCEAAFTHAANKMSQCTEEIKISSPFCGHTITIPCHMHDKLKGLAGCTPITTVKEGEPLKGGFQNITCDVKVTYERKCGHKEEMACSKAREGTKKQLCGIPVSIPNPLCGHPVSMKCHQREFNWAPWGENLTFSNVLINGVVHNDIAVPENAPKHLEVVLGKCTRPVSFYRRSSCGHEWKNIRCSSAMGYLRNPNSQPDCSMHVTTTLPCGHVRKMSCHEREKLLEVKYVCKELAEKKCWNFEVCGETVTTTCGSTDIVQCNSSTEWSCGRHTFELQVCQKGRPTECPSCVLERLSADIARAEKHNDEVEDNSQYILEMIQSLTPPGLLDPACALKSSVKEFGPNECAGFFQTQATLLHKFKKWMSKSQQWEQQIYNLNAFFCFIPLAHQYQKARHIDASQLVKPDTFNGLQAYRWSLENIQKVVRNQNKEVTLLCGIVMSCRLLINPIDRPRNQTGGYRKNQKNRKDHWQAPNWLESQKMRGYDGMYICNDTEPEKFIIWEPLSFFETHRCKVVVSTLNALDKCIGGEDPLDIKSISPRYISMVLPDTAHAEAASGEATQERAIAAALALKKTHFSNLRFSLAWDGKLGDFPNSLHQELMTKLVFCQCGKGVDDIHPFGGFAVLKKLQARMPDQQIVFLLKALEHFALDTQPSDEGNEDLQTYLDYARRSNLEVHPLTLLAIARSTLPDKSTCLSAFAELYPQFVKLWLLDSERKLLNSEGNDHVSAMISSASEGDEALRKWTEMKTVHQYSSPSMDKLMSMVGLFKVKVKAVQAFKSIKVLMQLPHEARAVNKLVFNYVFFGNPGTGKKTASTLFQEIVQEASSSAQYRSPLYSSSYKSALVECSITTERPSNESETKDTPSSALQSKSKSASHSDPETIVFEDFTEEELRSIWVSMREKRGWACSDKVDGLATRKIARGRDQKGFRNAWLVESFLEKACRSALARDTFDNEMILTTEDIVGLHPLKNPKVKQVLDAINSKTGWSSIKKEIQNLVSLCAKNYELELDGQPARTVFLNRMFLGNPGTGKTTCAMLYGQLLKQLNFLSGGDVIKTTASDFIGRYIGHSEGNTNKILNQAKGKVLVIDEAYNLDQGTDNNNFGKLVLNVLVERIQNAETDDMCVLLIGYEEPMARMLRRQNPGLARRFPIDQAFRFEDYTEMELLKIFHEACKRENVELSAGVAKRALDVLSLQKNQNNFGNAGSVNTLLQSAIANAAMRLPPGEPLVLQPDDVAKSEALDKDPFEPLNHLYRMDKVKKELISLRNSFKVAEVEGDKLPEIGHFVFRGSPGTGKTTVARVIAKILNGFGIIATDKVVESSGLDLTGEYLGQTKKRVEEVLKQAIGGVLFIDEAYELGKGHYGREAMTSIVAAMTDPRYQDVVIIIAGYKADINEMLDRNQGLKSRFSRYLDFEDWFPNDCVKFIKDMCEKKSFKLDQEQESLQLLQDGFTSLVSLDGWGNGRDATKLWKMIQEERASRVMSEAVPEMEKKITFYDIQQALEGMIEDRIPPKVR